MPSGYPGGAAASAFAIVEAGVLSRSGTPTADQFAFLRESGWHGIVDVRTTDDRSYPGFGGYGFHYLQIPIELQEAPSDAQALAVLCFITDPANQPVDLHDNSGRERVGLFVALFRYSAQGWSMDAALREEASFGDILSAPQVAFLEAWATTHPPGRLP